MVKFFPHLHPLQNPLAVEDVVNSGEALADKKKIMRSLRWNSLLGSISRATGFIAGPVIASSVVAGLGIAAAKMAEIGVMSALAAGFTAPILITLAVGVAFAAVSIGADYASSRIWQSKQFDNLEINAKSTAHHLVQELKSNNMCLTTEQPARADGKSWGEFVREGRAASQQTQL